MKIKIIKLKVTSENQEFDFNEFFSGGNNIYYTKADLVEEQDGYYWHVLFTFEPKLLNNFSYFNEKKIEELPFEFIEELNNYIKLNPPKSKRSSNTVMMNKNQLLKFKTIKDFTRLKNLGKNSFEEDSIFFNDVLSIIKKYQK